MLRPEVRHRRCRLPRSERQVTGVERGTPPHRKDRHRHPRTHPGLGAADPAAQLRRGQPLVQGHDAFDRADLLRDGEIGAVHVLRQHRLDGLDGAHVPHDGGNVAQARLDTSGVAAVPGHDPVRPVVVRREHDEGLEDAVGADRPDQLGQISVRRSGVVGVRGEVGQVEPAQLRLTRRGLLGAVVGDGFGGGHDGATSKVAAMVWIHGHDGVSVATRRGSTWAQVSSDARTHTSPCSASTRRAAVIATPNDDVRTCSRPCRSITA